MKARVLRGGWLAVFVVVVGWARAESGEVGYYPLAKGNRWTYEAVVGWTKDRPAGSEAPPEVATENMTWTVEVKEVFDGGSVVAARMLGSVRDLTWYEPGKKPSEWLLVKVGANHYHAISEEVDETWRKIVEAKGVLALEVLTADNLMLETPLVVDTRWGEFEQTPRGEYCYRVAGVKPFDPSSVKGVPALEKPEVYAIEFRTRPDHQVIEFVPYLGVVGYEYGHHGTVSTVKAKLVEFLPGGR